MGSASNFETHPILRQTNTDLWGPVVPGPSLRLAQISSNNPLICQGMFQYGGPLLVGI